MKITARLFPATQIISIILLVTFFTLSFSTSQLVVQGVLAGVASSFMFSLVTYYFDIFTQFMDRRRFRQFFGKAAVSNQLYLVYPTFVLSSEAADALKSLHTQLIFQKSSPKFSRPYRVDVPYTVAENDLRSLLYLARLFERSPLVRDDSEAVVHSRDSFISIGFTSSECTHMYLQHCEKPMFTVVPNTDGSEYITYINAAGQKVEVKSTGNVFYGIILKYHPDTEDDPDRVWFLCAGLGPNGTSGAAWYLANKWKRLYRLAGTEDFMAIIRVHHYSDQDSHLKDLKKRDTLP